MITSILSTAFSTFLSLIGITFIIVFHEFGHYIFCKLFGVYTPTFSIGIGKKLISKKIGDTNFCISAGPLGGYVEIATESTKTHKGFNSISYYKKFLIILGGIGCNILLAYMIFAGLLYSGMPDLAFIPYENTKPIVQQVKNSSLNNKQLQPLDTIISVNNTPINNKAEIIKQEINKAVAQNKNTIDATIKRNKTTKNITLHINNEKKPLPLESRLETTFERKAPLTIIQSISQGITLTHFYINAIFNSLKQITSSKNTKGLVGPIMAIAASTKGAQKGMKYLLILLAIISINLGIMNLLPLPIFDGGQFVIFTLEAIKGREFSGKTKERIGTFSWMLVITLFVIFTIKDIYTLIIG